MSRLVAQLLDAADRQAAILEQGLDRAFQAVFVELQLISQVSAASLGQHVAQGKPGHKVLSFAGGEPAEVVYWRRFVGCKTDTSRLAVISDGLAEIDATRYSRRPSIDCQTRDGRRQVGREASLEGAKKVARRYGYSLGHVYKLMKEHADHEARYGRKAA